MMDSIAIFISLVLALVSLLHLYWAFGGLWPGTDKASLVRSVIGEKNATNMPPGWLTFVVALAIAAAALWPLMWRSLVPYFLPQGLLWAGMIVLLVVFIGRGIAGYMPFFTSRTSAQPFARLNALYFSPLCLIIGAGFMALLLNV